MPSLPVIIGLTIELFVCLAGLIFGYWRERTGALIYLGALLLAILLKDFTSMTPVWRYFLPDSLCLTGFLCLCWKSPHPWPLWATGAQLVSVCLSLAAWLNPYVMKWAYFTALTIFGYAVVLSLGVGVFSAIKRRFSRTKSSQIG